LCVLTLVPGPAHRPLKEKMKEERRAKEKETVDDSSDEE
jgi:hypothetical protein